MINVTDFWKGSQPVLVEEGAYALSATPQSNLIEEPALTKRMFEIIGNLDSDADDRFYLMAPDHNCKLAFSEWITRPEQRTKENYAAFEHILSGLVAIVEGDAHCATTTALSLRNPMVDPNRSFVIARLRADEIRTITDIGRSGGRWGVPVVGLDRLHAARQQLLGQRQRPLR